MKKTSGHELPEAERVCLRRAIRLQVFTMSYMAVVVVLMALTMGGSQAMRAALFEDLLVFVPPVAFLIAARVRRRPPNEKYPYGYHRVVGIAFLASAVALMGFGLFLLYDSVATLVRQEHTTIGSVEMFGRVIWQGWIMLPVLVFSAVGPVILGRLMVRPARQLHDKVLHSTSDMLKADWMSAGAAFAGILGIGAGWWWADAVAAGIISLDILYDGSRNLKAVTGDLMDRAPETTDLKKRDPLPDEIRDRLRRLAWVKDVDLRMRENGHVLFGEVFIVPVDSSDPIGRSQEAVDAAKEVHWRVHTVVVQLVDDVSEVENPDDSSQDSGGADGSDSGSSGGR